MEKLKVFIITEGSSNIGFGHITRMLSIYQAFKEKNINPKFIINGDNSIKDLVKNTNYEIYNWLGNKEKLLKEIKNADIVIIDSYLADKSLYEKISETVKLPVYYDDNNRINYTCGIVINGNIHAFDLNYPQKNCIKYLLGTKYLPLRKEFWDVPEKEINENLKSIMITFGGDDIRNMTPKVLKILKEKFPNITKKVVIGKGFKNINEIEREADNNTQLIYYPDAKEMKNIMLNSNIAISAAGQTLYELARTGTPAIAIVVAENQIGNAKGLKNAKFLDDFFIWNDENIEEKLLEAVENLKQKEKREEKKKIGKSLVDGRGTKRIVDEILRVILKEYIYMRNAKENDIWNIYEISNEPEVRQVSINNNFISKNEHRNWYLKNYKKNFYVLDFNGKAIGQLRFRKEEDKYIVSISLKKEYRGFGLSKYLLKKGIERFFKENKNVDNIVAYIKKDNLKSKNLFKSFSFKYIDNFDGFEIYELLRKDYERYKN